VSLRYDEIAEILKIIENSSCDEFIVETGDLKLVVRRNGATGHSAMMGDASVMTPGPTALPPVAPRGRDAQEKIEITAGQFEVIAPMIGTFYRAPNPDAPPFVEVGTIVRAGQPLCLIEVMKLFTTINSEVAGRVINISAENGELVEYGCTLFVIEPV
jgi:acetyl-CoA carboxylase biotin carboxyl carrier protein